MIDAHFYLSISIIFTFVLSLLLFKLQQAKSLRLFIFTFIHALVSIFFFCYIKMLPGIAVWFRSSYRTIALSDTQFIIFTEIVTNLEERGGRWCEMCTCFSRHISCVYSLIHVYYMYVWDQSVQCTVNGMMV